MSAAVMICHVRSYRIGSPGWSRAWSIPGEARPVTSGPGSDGTGYPGPREPDRAPDRTFLHKGAEVAEWDITSDELAAAAAREREELVAPDRDRSLDRARERFLVQALALQEGRA